MKAITVKNFSNIIQATFEQNGYSTYEKDDSVCIFEAPDNSIYGRHLVHFPLDICFCDGIKFLVIPRKDEKVKTKSIQKQVQKVLNHLFN